jgi:HSP20 family protein
MAETAVKTNGGAARPAPARVTFTPRVDILETPDELRLLLDLPGVKPDGVDVRFERGELTVLGRCAATTPAGKRLAAEYEVGDYYRAFLIGEEVAADRITAELTNGVLTVHLPRAESAKARRIAVQAS